MRRRPRRLGPSSRRRTSRPPLIPEGSRRRQRPAAPEQRRRLSGRWYRVHSHRGAAGVSDPGTGTGRAGRPPWIRRASLPACQFRLLGTLVCPAPRLGSTRAWPRDSLPPLLEPRPWTATDSKVPFLPSRKRHSYCQVEGITFGASGCTFLSECALSAGPSTPRRRAVLAHGTGSGDRRTPPL